MSIKDILQVLNPLIEELLLGKEFIIFGYIKICYLATGLSELSCSYYYFFLEAREN